MSNIVLSIVDKYNYVFHELADPRTQDWWGVSNPFTVVSIIAAYLYFCKSLGPRLMENRKPFELKRTILFYNFFQVLLSLFLTYLGSVYIFSREYDWSCDVVDYSNKPRALFIAGGSWWYYFAKITELLDTVFFVLRKKYNQVSFLHVYHHTIMSFFVWMGVKYFPGGHVILMGYLNSIVHVIMYSYYLISGLGPEYQKYLWWKKHVTLIQLIQFGIVFVHNFSVFFYDCAYPRILNILCCANAVAFIYMFGKFYITSYNKQSGSKSSLKAKDAPVITNNVHSHSVKRNGKEKAR